MDMGLEGLGIGFLYIGGGGSMSIKAAAAPQIVVRVVEIIINAFNGGYFLKM